MGLELPSISRELVSGSAAVRRSARQQAWWLVALALVLGGSLPVLLSAPADAALATLPWLAAPFIAMLAWLRRATEATARSRAAFYVFSLAGLVGVAAHLANFYAYRVTGTGGVAPAAYLFVALHPVMAGGLLLSFGRGRHRIWRPGAALDWLLVLAAAAVLVLRFGLEPALAGIGAAQESLSRLAILHALSLVPLSLATVLVLQRGAIVSPWSATALLSATMAFAAGSLMAAPGIDPRPLMLSDPLDYLWLLGWAAMAFAALTARSVPATAAAMIAGRRGPDRLRKRVVPAAALLLALGVVDLALRSDPRPVTVLALVVLGLILTVRTAQAYSMADAHADQERQIAHTRALVEVTHALAGTTGLDQTLNIISQSARTVLGARAAGIELLSDDGTTLETRAAVGLPGSVMGLHFPVEGSFTGWVVQHGEPRATVDPSEDPYIQPQSLDFLTRSPVAAAPIRFQGQTRGALFACNREEPFDPEELKLLGALAEQAGIAIHNASLFERVTALSITDPLTGLANRRQLQRELEREFAAARRGRSLAVAIFDLNDFKDYNDAHGHLAGDEALQAFAESLQEETRTMNLAARYGGDEFVAVLSESDHTGAEQFIERVRDRFRRRILALGRGEITVAAGMAVFGPEMADPEALLRAADQELYRSKPRART